MKLLKHAVLAGNTNYCKRRLIMRTFTMLSLLLAAWFGNMAALHGQDARATMDDSTLAIVNGERISTGDLAKELMRIHSGQSEVRRSNFNVEKLVNKLINDRLMIQEAHLLELDQDPKFLRKIEAHRLKQAAARLLRKVIPDTFSVSDDEVNTFFNEQFRQYRFAMLSVHERKLADSLFDIVKLQGGDTLQHPNIKELAKQFSVDMYRYRGGDRGLQRWIDIENIIKVRVQHHDGAESIKVGEIAAPFANHDAFSFFQLLEQKPANPEELAANRTEIISILKMQKIQTALNQFVEKLKRQSVISIDKKALDTVKGKQKPSSMTKDNPGPVLARVGSAGAPPGAQITAFDYYYKLMQRGKWSSEMSIDSVAKETVDELIRDKLFEQEAVRRNIEAEPEVVENTKSYQDSLLVMTYLEQTVSPQINITQADIDSVYEANRESYRGPSDIIISQITVAGKASADSLMARLKGGANFGWLAKTYSTDDYAAKGGDYGKANAGEFPENIRRELESSPLGQSAGAPPYLGPYPAENGFVIIRLKDRIPGKVLELSAVAENIRQQLYQMEFNRVLDKTLESLKSASHISLNQKVIDHLAIEGAR
jgi:parvulin-like peptidyl-prolyl isomerase